MSEVSVLGIDLAKQMFHAVAMDETGTIVWRQRITRSGLMPLIAQLPPVVIGLEACGGAHDWARRFREHGHVVKLMAPQLVKPYVKSNTHEIADAEAVGEAITRPTMRFVPIKESAQQDFQALHRVRERLIKARTAGCSVNMGSSCRRASRSFAKGCSRSSSKNRPS
jgi:transposase